MKKIINNKALFLGSKSENFDYFNKIISDAFMDAAFWRKNYHPEDDDIITAKDKDNNSFIYTKERVDDVLEQVSTNLRSGSIPWHSPRYLGHMNSETLMPGIIAYFQTMFYNGNNVAYESSPATSKMEDEVGMDFCKLLGYETNKGWGHICTDGSVANYEGLWYARNFKSLPFAIKESFPKLVEDKTDWELANMPIDEILTLMEDNKDKWDVVKNASVRSNSKDIDKLGVVFVPRTKHYSWLKAADILGIGTNNVVPIDVDEHFRMNVKILEEKIHEYTNKKIPILMVVSVVGTTEEGMVDYVEKVVALREKLKKDGIWFYYHIDAAYGGYARSIILDEKYKLIPFDKLQDKYKEYQVFEHLKTWPSKHVYDAYANMCHADSITIDPHKMGYAPYAAGGIAIRDIRMRNAISYFATYVFDTKVKIPDLLGAYIMEGSKAGATAAAVWTNHRVLPLNIEGYGKLMGQSIEGAFNLYQHLLKTKCYQINNKKINVYPLVEPDFNMVDFVFNYEGNNSLEVMNDLNQNIYNATSFVEGATYINNLLLSHTSFSSDDYKNAPMDLLKTVGIKTDFKNKEVIILRSCVLSPWLYDKQVAQTYFEKFDKAIVEKLSKIIN